MIFKIIKIDDGLNNVGGSIFIPPSFVNLTN